LDLEASPEVVPASVGLVLSPEARPVQRVVNEVFNLVADVEQASDLSDGERDLAALRSGWGVPLSWVHWRLRYC
jgi:hypothetical protein